MNFFRQKQILPYLLAALLVGIASGSASALFLHLLDLATETRMTHPLLFWGLPLSGAFIGWTYYRFGQEVVRGNNQIIETAHQGGDRLSWKMAPLILFSTLLTHLVGGSAGREGTAVQMGGALADQLNRFFRSFSIDRKTLMGMGVASGFAAVFGTPWAGLLFGIEVLSIRKSPWKTAIVPMALAAWTAHLTCLLWGGEHTEYTLGPLVSFSVSTLGWLVLAGVVFGATAWLFTATTRLMGTWWGKISYPPLRPFLGGLVLMGIFLCFDTQQYAGLGVDQIVAAFSEVPDPGSWLIKLGLTAFTLGAGFKGGEVTPLFFVGATLGSVLSGWIPLPMGLLAGMGFIAVFSGASHAPLACIAMGVELFGLPALPFMGISSIMAYLVSGPTGMYSAQHPSWIKAKINQLIPAKEF